MRIYNFEENNVDFPIILFLMTKDGLIFIEEFYDAPDWLLSHLETSCHKGNH